MIQAEKLFHHFGGKKVLNGPSLTVHSGEIVVVMGPNGMGKSTMLSCIGGALVPTGGSVSINGLRRYTNEQDEMAVRQKIMYLPDSTWVPDYRTCRQWAQAVAVLYCNDEIQVVDHVEALISLFDMDNVADAPISSYSAGQRKKTELIMALAPQTPVLVMDEPFSGGLDPTGLYAIKEILRRRAHVMNHAVLIATPTPELVEEIADRIVILRNGEITAQGTMEQLRQQSSNQGSLVRIYEQLSSSEIEARLKEYEQRFLTR